MNGFPPHVYFVRHTPIARLKYKNKDGDGPEQWESLKWYRDLRDDIDKNGLTCPLLVGMIPGPYNRFGEFGVRIGHHRLAACEYLGWTHVPCVIHGAPLPEEWEKTQLDNINEMHDLMVDAKVENRWETVFFIYASTMPETGKYPRQDNPYFNEPSEQI